MGGKVGISSKEKESIAEAAGGLCRLLSEAGGTRLRVKYARKANAETTVKS